MAGSPTPAPTASEVCSRALTAWQDAHAIDPSARLAVACSAGADSTALALLAVRLWPDRVSLLHVHHGLQSAADTFALAVTELGRSLAAPVHVAHVDARAAAGESPEETARDHRYAALVDLARQAGARHVLLAQHADDQLETLLLALSRGAGLPGLASMSACMQRGDVWFHRPWLAESGARLREVLAEQGQAWVEDPTNADVRYTRNRIRAELVPALLQVFPQARETFARSARHAAQAADALRELAEIDLRQTGVPPRLDVLQTLSDARMANALRHWLVRHQSARAPSDAQMQALLRQVRACTTRGHHIDIRVGSGQVVRRAGVLGWVQ